ncbi:TlyA family rRNA (cytidine-2'-O)-methyltransferase [Desulfosarcina alkanivorans]|uniref:TlyA family rRNA (Cytidine-2'-O)-methyltransferase n=1 Tax=Desulfosarcina alkanivorans TaxID=571177 RepID=A0A5K7YGS3_9BACT|nr:TlyA family RNA methyltransferase [Desulfosarcina alkanivorans]BBO67019.1 TlyA family rRNA (cytidine-2'-O)-methyltransferase [Desulfosarcina alkanivorans]
MAIKKRIDALLVEKGLCQSRERAKALIMAGRVLVNHLPCDKPGSRFSEDAGVTLKGDDMPYVSRGGLKLEAALTANHIDCTAMVCLDVGASTGGFTDCLLQHGAAKVFAVDVGYGQLAWPLRQDDRVIVIERTNIRKINPETITEPVDLVTIDTSFISLKIVVPAIVRFLKPGGRILALIKPQFEAGKGRVGKGGVVRDPALHAEIIDDLRRFFSRQAMVCGPVIPSPVLGPKGNREFIILLQPSGDPSTGDRDEK